MMCTMLLSIVIYCLLFIFDMMISFAIGFVIIFNDWQEYISFFSSKTLLVQASSYSSKTAAYLNVFDKLRRGSPIPISGEMGTLNNKLFDPLELASEENFAQYREAELKHGRVAMLATVGMTLPEMLSNIKLPVELPEFGNLYLSASKGIKFSDVPYGLKAISHVPWQGWFQIFVVIGILETQIFVVRIILV